MKMIQVGKITLNDVYSRFAQMTIRGKMREIFSQYEDYDAIMSNYARVNKEVSAMVIDTFKRCKVPLNLTAGQLSNVKTDGVVLEALNQQAAAKANVDVINRVGAAIRANPGYLEKYKWDMIEKISGKGVNLTIVDGGRTPTTYSVNR